MAVVLSMVRKATPPCRPQSWEHLHPAPNDPLLVRKAQRHLGHDGHRGGRSGDQDDADGLTGLRAAEDLTGHPLSEAISRRILARMFGSPAKPMPLNSHRRKVQSSRTIAPVITVRCGWI